ncbi:MAG: (2Fe-2S)-binding protein [Planctomycetales bacterium]
MSPPQSASILESSAVQPVCQGEVVCRCLRVTDYEIQDAIDTLAAVTVKDLGRCTGAGQGCNSCHFRLRQMLKQ